MENAPVIFDRMPEFSRIGSFSFMFWAIFIGLFLSLVVNLGPAFITLVQTSIIVVSGLRRGLLRG